MGSRLDTDQSLPKATTAPLFSMLAIGYMYDAVSLLMKGSVRSVM